MARLAMNWVSPAPQVWATLRELLLRIAATSSFMNALSALTQIFPVREGDSALSRSRSATLRLKTDPSQALRDYELAEQRFDALPESKQSGLSSARMRANLLRKKAMAMRELGEYSQAAPLFDQALTIQKQIAAADPKDTRSLFDVYVDLTQAAENYEDSADPAFAADPRIRDRNLALAVPLLKEAESIEIQLLKENPSNDDWKVQLADVQVRLGTAEQNLNASGDSAALSAIGLATLKEMAAKHPDSILILDDELSNLLTVMPLTLREPLSWRSHAPSAKRF